MKKLLLFLLPASLFSAITGLNVVTSNTQAVFTYTAPTSSACTVEVSESATYSPLVNDVNATYFTNANLDSRDALTSNGLSRQFIAGKRTIEATLAAGNKSRALQADTKHYYRITCGADILTGSVNTKSISFGNTYLEPPAVDASNPGSQMQPSLNASDRTESVIDPLTGAFMKKMTLPNDLQSITNNAAFNRAYDVSGVWTNPTQALVTAVSGTNGASVSANTGKLFLGFDNFGYAGHISFPQGNFGGNTYSMNYVQPSLTAIATGTCSPAANCTINTCVSLNGVSCAPNAATFSTLLTTTSGTTIYGTGSIGDVLQTTGLSPYSPIDVAQHQGNASCTIGTPTVTTSGRDLFSSFLTLGSGIGLSNGTTFDRYVISSVAADGKTATLTTNCTQTYTSAAYSAPNFGLLVWKANTSSDSVKIQAATYNYQVGFLPNWTFTGLYDICSPNTVTGGNGGQGYMCYLPQNGNIFWVDSTTAESHVIGRYLSNGSIYDGSGQADTDIFDPVNANIWYSGGSAKDAGYVATGTNSGVLIRQAIFSHQYYGNYADHSFDENEALTECNTGKTNQPCVVTVELTNGLDMRDLANAFDTTFNKAAFQRFYLSGFEDSKLIFRIMRGDHYTIGWTVVFDPYLVGSAAGCVGSGKPGCIIGMMSSWQSPGSRWCNLKANDPIYIPGFLQFDPLPQGYSTDFVPPGHGYFAVNVTDGVSFTTTGKVTCPTNSLGATGVNCINVTVDGEPHNTHPCTSSAANCYGYIDTGANGELGAALPGDYFTLNDVGIGPAGSGIEELMLIQKTDATHWIFQRGLTGDLQTVAANPRLTTFCNAYVDPTRNGVQYGANYWNYPNDPHAQGLTVNGKPTLVVDHWTHNAHVAHSPGVLISASAQSEIGCQSGSFNCYSIRTFPDVYTLANTQAVKALNTDPFFANKAAIITANSTQAHPNAGGFNTDHRYFFDGRPFNGDSISGSITGNGSNPGTLVGGQLYKFTTAQMPYIDRKFYPTFANIGSHVLLDTSGPGSVIGQTTADGYKYCVALLINECVSGSAVGDIYVNGPGVTPYCYFPSQASSAPDLSDVCIANNSPVYNSLVQVDSAGGNDNTGTNTRVLTHFFGTNKLIGVFLNGHTSPDGKWLAGISVYLNGYHQVFFTKVPTPRYDTTTRTTFVERQLKISPSVTTNNVIVEFGYNEYGTTSGFPLCTTRAELCAVGNNTTGIQTVPFHFLTTESASLTGTPCATTCSVSIPALPDHVLYWRVLYRDAGNAIVQTGLTNVVVVQ